MSTRTRSILVEKGALATVDRVENGGEVYPGSCVTMEGETWPDVALPDAISDSAYGIAGLLPNHDIDTIYTDNDVIPIHRCGSGDVVMGHHKGTGGGGSIVAGDILIAYGNTANGYVRPLSKALASIIADHTSTVLATAITQLLAIMGRAMETHASAANDVPIEILLSI